MIKGGGFKILNKKFSDLSLTDRFTFSSLRGKLDLRDIINPFSPVVETFDAHRLNHTQRMHTANMSIDRGLHWEWQLQRFSRLSSACFTVIAHAIHDRSRKVSLKNIHFQGSPPQLRLFSFALVVINFLSASRGDVCARLCLYNQVFHYMLIPLFSGVSACVSQRYLWIQKRVFVR